MRRNLSSLNFGSRNSIRGNFETTYKSTYGNFYPEFNNSNNNFNTNNNYNANNKQKYCTNKNTDSKHPHLILNQTNFKIPNSKLICPNCINENIINMKSHSKIKRKKKEIECFGDKMKTIHENKKKADIENREERSRQTYSSLFDNRGRSQEVYKNIPKPNDGKVNREGEYFGKDIEYGMLRCRNRELQNDKTLFGIDLNRNNEARKKRLLARNNKSWYGKYVLDKNEYCQIINTQIEKNNKKSQKEKNLKLREENKLLTEQLKDERNKIKTEINNKNNIRDEMNRVNSYLLKEKKDRENDQKKYKKKEKENISNLCKKEIEDFVKNLKMKKIQNQIVDEDNYRYMQIKNKNNETEKIKNLHNIYNGLSFKGVENNKCDQCNRPYPKNVLSQLYYTYDVQQKK